jgi:hypothetical protein
MGTTLAALASCTGDERPSTVGEPTGTAPPTPDAPSTTPVTASTTPAAASTSTVATTAAATTTTEPGSAVTTSGWVIRENRRPGTDAWRITDPTGPRQRWQIDGAIEGFADSTSARVGDTVRLYVSTSAGSWHVEVYRMGWYGGSLGRQLWVSDERPGATQSAAQIDPSTRMHHAPWVPSIELTVADDWAPGSYLLKLVSSSGAASYVPLTVRQDDAVGGLVLVNAVTTWQAYNPWSGRSLYESFLPGNKAARSLVVSFDRPYALSYAWGAADFLTHELPLIALIEQLGLDVVYVTDVDLHTAGVDVADSGDPGGEGPALLRGRTALLTTGHDEYYSLEMRDMLERARAQGINLAFFGANAVYRSIRLEPNAQGEPARQMANYRKADADPLTEIDPSRSTVQWRNPPLRRPENELIGVQYVAAGVVADMVIVRPENWMFAGVTLAGRRLDNLVAIEADALGPRSSEPPNLEVVASSPATAAGRRFHHAMTYYAHPSGAGVVATGTIAWIMALDAESWGDLDVTTAVTGITTNIVRAFAAGPCGTAHPSVANAGRYPRTISSA